MRIIQIGILCWLLFIAIPIFTSASILDEQTVIIEVDGDPYERAEEMKQKDALLEIIATYDTLLNGVAVKGRTSTIQQLLRTSFVRAIHPAQTYETTKSFAQTGEISMAPNDLSTPTFTGKGVKVGVIDTGIDYTHPDLQANYQGGYDVVDFDEDPMETPNEGGFGTVHGTHVAGIIAANGHMRGVAPEADIYAYRALGPGGQGTSVQVIAAMEEAVKDGMDVLNLSLGNTVNGPDFPTSIAVNRAEELDVITVIANGNAGPDMWTIGSPATASNAFSVGAIEQSHEVASVQVSELEKNLPLVEMIGAPAWDLEKIYPLAQLNEDSLRGSIVLAARDDVPFTEKAIQAEEQGAVALLVYDPQSEDVFQGSIDGSEKPITIPVASISKKDAEQLLEQEQSVDIETVYTTIPDRIAPFSSRGPVTMEWTIKPDIIAPGARIQSTVPGGYEAMDGTSMAAPHVTGGVALLKEAHPTWSNQQIVAALETTATQMVDEEGEPFVPTEQGMGAMDVEAALDTNTLLYEPKLSFGKAAGFKEEMTSVLTVENLSAYEQTYRFSVPRKTKGLHWTIPRSFTVAPKESKEIPISVEVTQLMDEGVHEGWLALHQDKETFHLPYVFIYEEAEQPKSMGFEFHLDPVATSYYTYQMYLTEEVDSFVVDLYNTESLLHEGTLLELDEVETGLNEGEVLKKDIPYEGMYIGVITIYLSSGEIDRQIIELPIMPQ